MMRHFYGASGFENNRLREAAFEDVLEAAYWNMDALRKRPGMPMSERDAFKAAVRAMLRKERS
jgi:hypothetical protein